VEHGQRGVISVDAKEDFVVWIVLVAEAGKVVIGLRIKTEDRLDIADGGKKVGRLELRQAEIAKAAEDGDAIVDERDRGYGEECDSDYGPGRQGKHLNQVTTLN
jgi:hypothetical protein